MVHIPKSMEAQALRWIEDFKRASALLEALNEQGRLRLDAAKATKKKAQTASKKKTSYARKAEKQPS